MSAAPSSRILAAFGVRERRYLHLIGGGGKTTLMFALAHALAAEGRNVLTTTTTRILFPEPGESDRVVLGTDAGPLIERLKIEFETRRHVTAAARHVEAERKLVGLPVALLDAVLDAAVANHVLVEADGSAGRSLKAHREHEPVVSARADLVIAVIGVDCIGAPMDDVHVHRAALLRERLGRPVGTIVTAEDVAGILFHREGYLARVERGCEVVAFVNQVTTPAAREDARRLAGALRASDAGNRLARVIVGDVRTGSFEDAG